MSLTNKNIQSGRVTPCSDLQDQENEFNVAVPATFTNQVIRPAINRSASPGGRIDSKSQQNFQIKILKESLKMKGNELEIMIEQKRLRNIEMRRKREALREDTAKILKDMKAILAKYTFNENQPGHGKIPRSTSRGQLNSPRVPLPQHNPPRLRRSNSTIRSMNQKSDAQPDPQLPTPTLMQRSTSAPRPKQEIDVSQTYKDSLNLARNNQPTQQLPASSEEPPVIQGYRVAQICYEKAATGSFHCRRQFEDIKSDQMRAFVCCNKIYCCSACHRWEEGCDAKWAGVVCNWCFKEVVNEVFWGGCNRKFR